MPSPHDGTSVLTRKVIARHGATLALDPATIAALVLAIVKILLEIWGRDASPEEIRDRARKLRSPGLWPNRWAMRWRVLARYRDLEATTPALSRASESTDGLVLDAVCDELALSDAQELSMIASETVS